MVLVTFLVGCLLPLAIVTAWDAPIVISGAGPASLLFANRYLRCDETCKIIIYEKLERPSRYIDSQEENVAGDYAFGFGVSSRAQRVLQKVPNLLESVKLISQKTKFSSQFVNRREFCAELLHELEREFGSSGRLQIHFEESITDLDPSGKKVEVTDKHNVIRTVPYSLLIGADGANSLVRSKLVERGDIQGERFYCDQAWKALQLPKQPGLVPGAFLRYPKNLFRRPRHLRKDNGAILPRFKDRFYFLNFRSINCENSNPFGVNTPAEFKEALQKIEPKITNFPSDEVLEEFLAQRPRLQSHMKLDKHAIEDHRIALLGDAANGMYSMLGQGCSSALVQAEMLVETLAETDDLAKALSKFSDASVKEGHAVSDLNLLQHVMQKPFPINIYAILKWLSLAKDLTKHPETPYSEIYNKNRRVIRLGRYFWRKERISISTKQKLQDRNVI